MSKSHLSILYQPRKIVKKCVSVSANHNYLWLMPVITAVSNREGLFILPCGAMNDVLNQVWSPCV